MQKTFKESSRIMFFLLSVPTQDVSVVGVQFPAILLTFFQC